MQMVSYFPIVFFDGIEVKMYFSLLSDEIFWCSFPIFLVALLRLLYSCSCKIYLVSKPNKYEMAVPIFLPFVFERIFFIQLFPPSVNHTSEYFSCDIKSAFVFHSVNLQFLFL